jgi:hypothetical protein
MDGRGKTGCLGPGKGLKNGAVDPEWVDVCILVQRATTQSKRALINFFLTLTINALLSLYVP